MPNVFDITETLLPVCSFEPGDNNHCLDIVEQDTRNSMRQLAEAEFSLSQQEQQHTDKARRFLLDILEVLDAFERLFDVIENRKDQMTDRSKRWIANFRTVYRILKRTLSKQGVAPIENLAQGFDPHWHNAVEKVTDTSKQNGTIVEERKKGYVWQNQILREAEVVVVRNPKKRGDPLSDPLKE